MKTVCTQMFKYAIDQEITTTNYAALVEWFYELDNEYLLTVDGESLLNGQNLRLRIWDKSPLLKNHLLHDGRRIDKPRVHAQDAGTVDCGNEPKFFCRLTASTVPPLLKRLR